MKFLPDPDYSGSDFEFVSSLCVSFTSQISTVCFNAFLFIVLVALLFDKRLVNDYIL